MHKSGLVEFEAVLAVARFRGFRPAAAELGMSTTALSNAVAGFEARLGVRLFHRTTRSVTLTEAGEQLVDRLGPALADIHGALDAVNQHRRTPRGTLRINTSAGAMRMLFEPLVQTYLQRYPDMRLDVVTEGRLVDIVAGGFDAGIRPGALVPKDMVRVPLGGRLPMCIVGAPAYFAQHPAPRSPDALGRHRCIRARLPSGAAQPWALERRGELRQIDVPGQLVFDEPTLMLQAARAGVGMAHLARWYVADDLASGQLVQVLGTWTPPVPGLALYYPAGRHVPTALRLFIDLARELGL